MKKKLAFLVIFLASTAAHADEYYGFYRIQCDKEIPAFEIERTYFWNIRQIIWPDYDWAKHVQSLKKLETSSGLYVFDEFYGYYDSPELSFNCGPIDAKINSSQALREEGAVGSQEPVRVSTTITITSSELSLVDALPISSIKRLRAYLDSDGKAYTEVCNSQKCVDDLSDGMGTITAERIDRILSK